MFGVVLWSDPHERKAVIWCEDHGDLAFFHDDKARAATLALDAGDLVEFDVETDRNLRYANNPQLVSEGSHRNLADTLRPQQTQGVTERASDSAQIIPFNAVSRRLPRHRQHLCRQG